MELFDTTIAMRTIYRKVALSGDTTYSSADSKARNEMALLADEVISIFEKQEV